MTHYKKLNKIKNEIRNCVIVFVNEIRVRTFNIEIEQVNMYFYEINTLPYIKVDY